MGYYEGQRENPCPRCGSVVYTLFVSISPMSFSQKCSGCKTTSFSKPEEKLLGSNQPLTRIRHYENEAGEQIG